MCQPVSDSLRSVVLSRISVALSRYLVTARVVTTELEQGGAREHTVRRAGGVTNSTKVMITTVLTTKELCFAQMYQDNLYPLHVAYICDLEPAGWWFCAVASTVNLCTRVLTAIGCGGPQVTYHGCAQTLTSDRPLSSSSAVRLKHAAIDINIYIYIEYIYILIFIRLKNADLLLLHP